MKRLRNVLAFLAGTAVFLLATAHFTLRYKLNTPEFKEALTGFIERGIGRAADYERIDYSLFPFSLVVQNASIKEKDGAQDFASIGEFSAAVDFRAKEISSLRLDRPTLRIVQRADGTFNFSDLISEPAKDKPAPGQPPRTPSGPDRPAPTGKEPAAAPPFAIRQVRIEDARFEFVRQRADQADESFILSDLNFDLRDLAPDAPVQVNGHAAIGRKSSFQFDLSGPPPAEYAERPGAWPVAFTARLDLPDFADVKAFLPEGTLPFQSLEATLNVQGALTDKLSVHMKFQTPEATATHPVSLAAGLQATLSLPAPVAAHLLEGAPLPEPMRVPAPPCQPPPGAMALTEDPALAVLLQHLQATAELTFPKIAYGGNVFEQGAATFSLRDGVLTIPSAKLSAYGGTLEARGSAQLLACPLSYRLERLAANGLAIEQALAANGLSDFADLSGRLQLEASGFGHAVAEPGLRALEADARLRIDNLQSVDAGGSLMDQVWRQLDHPLLLQWMPRLKTKVEQAKLNADNVATSRYDEATAVLCLREGRAAVSDARLGMPGYRLLAAGDVFPFDDRIELAARLLVSPEETAELTGGKDRSNVLPYEDGGLMVPLTVRGSLRDPAVRPDLDRLLRNALAGIAGGEGESPLDALSNSDRKNVEKGLKFLGDLLQP